jgi:hypothetical protein
MSDSKQLGYMVLKVVDMLVVSGYEFRSLQVTSISREFYNLEERITKATFLVDVAMYGAYENDDNGIFVGAVKCENNENGLNCFWKEKLKIDR